MPKIAANVVMDHLITLCDNLKERFLDLKETVFPSWMLRPLIVDLTNITGLKCQEELVELRNDDSAYYLV